MAQIIDSKHNEMIKYLRRLQQNRSFREQEQRFIVEGLRFTKELLDSEWITDKLMLTPEIAASEDGRYLYDLARSRGIMVQLVSAQVFASFSATDNPQGIAALAVCRGQSESENNYELNSILLRHDQNEHSPELLILTEDIQDPGNMGTIIRLADAAGAKAVLMLKGCVDIYNNKTLRATVGSIFHLPVLQNLNRERLLIQLKRNEWKIIAGVPSAEHLLCCEKLPERCVILVGNEANGISKELIYLSDECLAIPMPGHSESLNASSAAAIMMYEFVRQHIVDKNRS